MTATVLSLHRRAVQPAVTLEGIKAIKAAPDHSAAAALAGHYVRAARRAERAATATAAVAALLSRPDAYDAD
jgi:hypothetical protein